jgi:hypothetical protein
MCADSSEGDGLIAHHWSISPLAEDIISRLVEAARSLKQHARNRRRSRAFSQFILVLQPLRDCYAMAER